MAFDNYNSQARTCNEYEQYLNCIKEGNKKCGDCMPQKRWHCLNTLARMDNIFKDLQRIYEKYDMTMTEIYSLPEILCMHILRKTRYKRRNMKND